MMDELDIIKAVVSYEPTDSDKLIFYESLVEQLKAKLEESQAKFLNVLSILEGHPIKRDWFAEEIAYRAVGKLDVYHDELIKNRESMISQKNKELPVKWFDLNTHIKDCPCDLCKQTSSYEEPCQ